MKEENRFKGYQYIFCFIILLGMAIYLVSAFMLITGTCYDHRLGGGNISDVFYSANFEFKILDIGYGIWAAVMFFYMGRLYFLPRPWGKEAYSRIRNVCRMNIIYYGSHFFMLLIFARMFGIGGFKDDAPYIGGGKYLLSEVHVEQIIVKNWAISFCLAVFYTVFFIYVRYRFKKSK